MSGAEPEHVPSLASPCAHLGARADTPPPATNSLRQRIASVRHARSHSPPSRPSATGGPSAADRPPVTSASSPGA
jgi:hypothetical protein